MIRARHIQAASRKQGGHDAQAAGDSFEEWIAGGLLRLQNRGRIGSWAKQYPPMRATKIAGRLAFVLLDGFTGPPDFAVSAAGLNWAFDAKSTAGARLPWSAVKPHQAEDLSAWQAEAPHHRAALLVRFHVDGERVEVLVPWAVVESRWRAWASGEAARGDASLHVDEALRVGWAKWGAALAGEKV